ncbi:MAG TPA: hypothetical protein VHC22_10530 [Pirellulales bacterium]|nr:hypothetical protein [Pirellulales bacterium]
MPELLARPAGERVIMALGAIQIYSKKGARGARGKIRRTTFIGNIKATGIDRVFTASRGIPGEDLGNQAIVRGPLPQFFCKPLLETIGDRSKLGRIRLRYPSPAPKRGHVPEMRSGQEQPFHRPKAHRLGFVFAELVNFGDGRDPSDQI